MQDVSAIGVHSDQAWSTHVPEKHRAWSGSHSLRVFPTWSKPMPLTRTDDGTPSVPAVTGPGWPYQDSPSFSWESTVLSSGSGFQCRPWKPQEVGSAHPSCCLHPLELLHQSMKMAEAGAPLQSAAALVQSTQKLLKIQLARERRWPTHQITAAQISNIIYLQPSTCLQIKQRPRIITCYSLRYLHQLFSK